MEYAQRVDAHPLDLNERFRLGRTLLALGEVDAAAEDLAKAFYRIPYSEPSNVLFNLLGHLEGLFQRFAGTVDSVVGEGTQNTPVGTILARIEQGKEQEVQQSRSFVLMW